MIGNGTPRVNELGIVEFNKSIESEETEEATPPAMFDPDMMPRCSILGSNYIK